MTTRRYLLNFVAAFIALSLAGPAVAQSAEPKRVVASFSILGDMVERIGGEHVDVTTLVGPNGDVHVYKPTPQAARAVSEADILIVNGLQFEGWLDRLIDASDFEGVRVVATNGIEPIAYEGDHGDDHGKAEHDHGHGEKHAEAKHDDDHGGKHSEAKHDDDHGKAKHDHDHGEKHAEAKHDHDHGKAKHNHDQDEKHADAKHDDHHGHAGHHHGVYDPHAWQSLNLSVTYVDNITAALTKADPANAATFQANRDSYVAEIKALDAEIRAMMAALPESERTIVTSHDAFQYFGRDYGLTFLAPQGLGTESEASAQDVAKLIKQMRAQGIAAVFVENVADPRLLKQIANETGATVGGTLFPGALSGPDGPAPTYLDMMRHNAKTLASALSS